MSFSPNSHSFSGVDPGTGPAPLAPAAGEPLIVYRDVGKSFDGRVVLEGINLEINAGETIVILGRSGSGKTVMTSMLVGLLAPDEGTIMVAGQDLTRFKSDEDWRELRLRTGYLFQGSALYDSMSVGENVAFPMMQQTDWSQEEIERRVKDKLSQVGLEEAIDLSPAELSGGMKRRAALARSLALDPKFIIYDEPTAGLDPISGDGIGRLIRRLQHTLGVTSVVVSHDLRLTEQVADRVALLFEGKIAFLGTFQEFWQSPHPEARRFLHKEEDSSQ
jgi:phospholipid/cholesterol/gamma-HCH transport system ATP-binding protein|uniref:ATP-binding cassette domain-containing protein n=1 Tax=Desulfobacca acetoxidans TaxID=60893 RepID=A0A7V6DPD1_9BACT